MSSTDPPGTAPGQASGCPVSALAAAFDPFQEPYLSDPYPILQRLRSEEPVFYSPELDAWVVTRHEDAVRIFRDADAFSATIAIDPITPLRPRAIQKVIEIGYARGPALVNEDPPLHTSRRRLISEAFTRKRVSDLEPWVRARTTEYIDAFVKHGKADLVRQLAWEIPALAVFRFLGCPDEDIPLAKELATPRALFTWGRPTEDEQVRLVEEVGACWRYCKRHVDRLKDNLGDDVMSDILRKSREHPDLFDDAYLYMLCLSFVLAGHETTSKAAGNGFRILLEHRDAWEALCADPSLIPSAVEEILRHQSSVPAWRRRATRPVDVGGVRIPEGAKLLVVTGSANHDGAVFSDAERFEIHRKDADRHLAFGHGRHFCLGAPLARMELRVFLEEVTRRLPHLELTPGQAFRYVPNTAFRGPEHVWVQWHPAKNPAPGDRTAAGEGPSAAP
ncbi:cytochrome P450 [Sorangium sp. So ce1099]|uniref:cytochrome P450 n=1 Tax=Sorangium sp. So ce1099 TaxID=3133331 RepID=UPI003F6180F5